MRETWYVLEDGSVVNPSEVTNDNGILSHKSGKVAMRSPGVPMSRSVLLDKAGKVVDDGARPFGGKGDHDGDGKTGGAKKPEIKDQKPDETKAGYVTREQKAK